MLWTSFAAHAQNELATLTLFLSATVVPEDWCPEYFQAAQTWCSAFICWVGSRVIDVAFSGISCEVRGCLLHMLSKVGAACLTKPTSTASCSANGTSAS